jgi:elongation factor Ts
MSISKDTIVELRQKTGLGMMACKKALDENNGDVEKAIEELRKKGELKAASREGRATQEGVVASYIHSNNKIGAMVEVNCETDFVARNEDFVEFAKTLAMQIVAMSPAVVSPEDVSEDMVEKEKEIYVEQLKNEGKSGDMVEKILEGKLKKYREQLALTKQSFIKDQSKTVEDVLLDVKNKMGENVVIRRFERFQLGN